MIKDYELNSLDIQKLRKSAELDWKLRVARGARDLPKLNNYIEESVKEVKEYSTYAALGNIDEENALQRAILTSIRRAAGKKSASR